MMIIAHPGINVCYMLNPLPLSGWQKFSRKQTLGFSGVAWLDAYF